MKRQILLKNSIVLFFLFLLILSLFLPQNRLVVSSCTFMPCIENSNVEKYSVHGYNSVYAFRTSVKLLIEKAKLISNTTSDSNRNPLTVHVYRKSVYQAFHPDSYFG